MRKNKKLFLLREIGKNSHTLLSTISIGLFHKMYQISIITVNIVVYFLNPKIILPFSKFSTLRGKKCLTFNHKKIPDKYHVSENILSHQNDVHCYHHISPSIFTQIWYGFLPSLLDKHFVLIGDIAVTLHHLGKVFDDLVGKWITVIIICVVCHHITPTLGRKSFDMSLFDKLFACSNNLFELILCFLLLEWFTLIELLRKTPSIFHSLSSKFALILRGG